MAVLALKEKIAGEKGVEFAVERQKLFYAGKILDDTKPISEYKIEEKIFVVFMLARPIGNITQPSVKKASDLKVLLEMGFSQSVAEKALAETHNIGLNEAVDWLVAQGVSSDVPAASQHLAPLEQTLALVKREEIESYRLETIDLRQPADDEIVIRVDAVALCGSDIVLYKWNDVAKTIASLPFVPGHEVTGTVVSVGSSAFVRSSTATSSSSTSTVENGQRLLPGQRVCVENHFYCGQCSLCDEDRGDICLDMGQFGHGKKTDQGGCSQYAIVPARYCFPITTNISVDEAVLLEPLGVAHNAVEQLEVKGRDVLVLGCGPIGLLACSVASALGAKRVIAADVIASRLDLSRKMKADVTINMKTEDLRQAIGNLTNGQGVARILEATGAESVIGTMFSLLRKGGHVVMVGLPKSSIRIDSPAQNILFKSLQLRSIHGRRIYHTWQECERLIADGTVDVLPIVSHKLPLTRYAEAFDALISGQACKIIIDPQQ